MIHKAYFASRSKENKIDEEHKEKQKRKEKEIHI